MENDVKIAALKKGDYEMYIIKGIGYSQYKQQMAEDLAVNADLKIKGYINLNQRRMHRVRKDLSTIAGAVGRAKKYQAQDMVVDIDRALVW